MTDPRKRLMLAIMISLAVVFLNIMLVSSGNAEVIYTNINLSVAGYR